MKQFFITATGTDVGKTFITCALIHQLRARGKTVEALKPIISGYSDESMHDIDTAQIIAALGRQMTPENIAHISPWRFVHPLAPDMAAKREGRQIDYPGLIDFCREGHNADYLFIEGVGGAFVPIDNDHLVADWIADLGAPALVVTGSYLGTLSHTVATLEALKARGVGVHAVIISESAVSPVPVEETRDTLMRLCPGTPVGVVPRLQDWREAPDLAHLLGRAT